MRICSPQLGISPHSILGGEIYDRELLIQFANSGIAIDVILPFGKEYPKHKNLHITYEPIPFVIPPHIYSVYILPYLFLLYFKKKFDILRVHSPTFIGPAGILFKSFFPKVKLVGYYHWLGEGGFIEKLLNPYLIRNFDLIICDSFRTKRDIEKKFPYSIDKVYAVHNGVDSVLKPTKKSKKLLFKYHIKPSTITLLFMGLFTKRKNPLALLSIVRILVEKGFDIRLLFCGKGELEWSMREEINRLGLQKNVFIIPPVYGREKNNLMNIADIFVHPARNEGFSLSVIEAMAVGLPIVITRGFSASEAVKNGENGYLCSSEKEWEEKILLLITNEGLRRQIKKNNLKKAHQQFQWKIAAKRQLSYLLK